MSIVIETPALAAFLLFRLYVYGHAFWGSVLSRTPYFSTQLCVYSSFQKSDKSFLGFRRTIYLPKFPQVSEGKIWLKNIEIGFLECLREKGIWTSRKSPPMAP